MTVQVDTGDFARFAAKLKQQDRKVKNAVRRRLRKVAMEIGPEVVEEGASGLPSKLGEHVVAKGGKPTYSQTATGAALVLGKKKGPQIGRMDEGNLRHPTFGRPPWVKQAIAAGTFTEALEKRLPELREALTDEIGKIMKELG